MTTSSHATVKRAQAVPTKVTDQLVAMVDVSTTPNEASCISSASGADGEARGCVDFKLRVWERVPYTAKVSPDWSWMPEQYLKKLELYTWIEVTEGADITSASPPPRIKPGGCYYVEASAYDHKAAAAEYDASPVTNFRPYLQASKTPTKHMTPPYPTGISDKVRTGGTAHIYPNDLSRWHRACCTLLMLT